MYSLNKYTAAVSSLVVFTALIFILTPPSFSFLSVGQAPSVFKPLEFQSSKQNIWADLSDLEFNDVLTFLYSRPEGLNLTKGAVATPWDNRILLVEALSPNKSGSLQYLDGGSKPPARWAHVTVSRAATEVEEATLVDYMVGPLPADSATQILPLDFCYNSGRNYARNPMPNIEGFLQWINKTADEVSDITLDLLGGLPIRFNESDVNSLMPIPRISVIEDGRMVVWLQFYRAGPKSGAMSILPQGLYAKLDASSSDISNWKIMQWFYNGVLYNSTDMFRAAWHNPDFEKVLPNLDGDWTDTEDYSHEPAGREKPPPVMIQPSGPRYDIDRNQKFVSWMGFEFYIAFSQSTGISLFDIRFKNERIIYELGMQEALAHYAGADPTQGAQYFLDTFFSMGVRMFELVPGYDCPAYATYLSTSYHAGDTTLTNENNICLFEYTADHALQRHTTADSVSISRSQYLVLRSVSTVGNYDYTIDYLFYLDGSIEVKVRASGFIFGAFYGSSEPNNKTKSSEYGYRIHDAVSSSMHDHVINFKADLDIAGTTNTLVRVGVEPSTVSYEWEQADRESRNTMHLVNTPIREETGLDWPRNSGAMYIVLNNESTNAWGEKRGYRITPGTGMGTPPHLTILNSTSLGKAAEWAGRDLWVVKHKDTEPRSASPVNFIEPQSPLIDFAKFVDGEAIVQEDLVVYFNLGAHHIAHSGDIPNTLMHTSASSVMFTPHNFHDRDPSRESVQGVKLKLGAGGHKPRYFGGRYTEGVTLNITDLEPNLDRYQAVRHDVTDLSYNKSFMGV
ncbi:hypothetical protein MMC18_004420 [Xylographa bjoerkii]|nr:hypothetical protein [Xylographa bjoerkii]